MSHKIEREFIGGLIIYPTHLAEYVEAVDRRWFGDHTHRLLWGALLALRARGEEVDVLTVAAEARKGGAPPGAVSVAVTGIASSAHIGHHFRAIRQEAIASGAADLADRLRDLAPLAGGNLEHVLAGAREQIGELELALHDAPPLDLKGILAQTMARVTHNFESSTDLTGLDTGIGGLNDLCGGWQKGDLAIIGADTGIGKTTLLVNTLIASLKRGRRWLLVSPEMSGWQLGLRFLAPLARLDVSRIDRAKSLTPDNWARLSRAAADLARWNEGGRLVFDLSSGNTPGRILATGRRLLRAGGLDGIAVDYLQLCTPDRGGSSREEDINRIGWGLRQIAKELGVALIALSQLNDTWKRQDKDGEERGRPGKGNLRGSRTIAHHAALVALLHRTGDLEREGHSEIIIDKNRHGRCGRVVVDHHLAECRISDPTWGAPI
jgi:replicative DNA helicase